jgi:hypothetical protein
MKVNEFIKEERDRTSKKMSKIIEFQDKLKKSLEIDIKSGTDFDAQFAYMASEKNGNIVQSLSNKLIFLSSFRYSDSKMFPKLKIISTSYSMFNLSIKIRLYVDKMFNYNILGHGLPSGEFFKMDKISRMDNTKGMAKLGERWEKLLRLYVENFISEMKYIISPLEAISELRKIHPFTAMHIDSGGETWSCGKMKNQNIVIIRRDKVIFNDTNQKI